MSPYTSLSQITKKLQHTRSVQGKSVQFFRDGFAPSAARHHLTTEVKFEEELIDQAADARITENIQCYRKLCVRMIYIQLETDKVLWCSYKMKVKHKRTNT